MMIRKRYSKAPLFVFWLGAPWISLQFQGIEALERGMCDEAKKKGRRKGAAKVCSNACMFHGAEMRGIADWQGGA